MDFSLATNWDHELVARCPEGVVGELFGKLAHDAVGGGRASFLIPHISREHAAEHVRLAHARGITFNYLLNATCLGNEEWTRKGQRRIRQLLDWICDIGVDSVTVSIPYLVELIKQGYPSLKVGISTQVGIDNARRARFWEELGADKMTLSFVDINRNFRELRRVRKAVSCKIQLIANLLCLYGCPFYAYHSDINSHASQTDHALKGFVTDYCSLKCTRKRFEDPVEFMRAPWIRPEDLGHYQEAGVDSIKLVDRGMTTAALVTIIQAYAAGRHDGDLMDLMPHPSKNIMFQQSGMAHKVRYFFRPTMVNVARFAKGKDLFAGENVTMDNRALDGFIDFFLDNDCDVVGCQKCTHCEETAARAVTHTSGGQADRIQAYLDDLVSGRMFRYKD